jgi:tetratricopeptide (TPR) repeat protein
MQPAKVPGTTRLRDGITAAVLAVCTSATFAPAFGYSFVNFDDGLYVRDNEQVTKGLSLARAEWAFTTYRTANWHPLTWLSLQLDATLWPKPDGKPPEAFAYHFTNVLLHAANAALLFLALRALTGAYWRSVAVTLLFAVHPLRVESVAWVSERKDVLSVFFGLLALWAYADYVKRPSPWRYLAVAAAFAASLLSKPMLVTLPCLLLVLDWWPLGRWPGRAGRVVLEKVPLFVLVLASSWFTFAAQRDQGAVKTLEGYPVGVRLANAVVSYTEYLGKTAWPARLSPFYPHPGATLATWQVAVAGSLLAAVTAGTLALWRKAPYLLAGWLWFLGTLVPTIGIVQVGTQAMADRYSYFPQIGLLLALCWGVPALAGRYGREAVVAAAVAAVLLAMLTWRQLPIWRDSLSLWEHARRTSGECSFTLIQLGLALDEQEKGKDLAKVEKCYRRAIEIDDGAFNAHYNLGLLLMRQGRLDDAIDEIGKASRLVPSFPMAYLSLGDVYSMQGKLDKAAEEYDAAIDRTPGLVVAYRNGGLVEMRRGNFPRAAERFEEWVRLQPDSAEAHAARGAALLKQGDSGKAVEEMRRAVDLDPGSAQRHHNLGTALEAAGDLEGAEQSFDLARQLKPGMAEAWYSLGMVRFRRERWEMASIALARAVVLNPRSPVFGQELEKALRRLADSGQAERAQQIREQLGRELARNRGTP